LAALRYYHASLAVLRAESLMDLNRPQDAIEALRDIEATPNLEPQVLGQALKVRISAHQSLGQPEAALEEVRDLLARAPAQAPVVLGPMLQSLQREVDALLDASRDDQAVELAQRMVLPFAQLYEQWLIEHDQSPDEQHGLLIANAYRHSGQCERALQWYERLLRDHPDALELLLGRAECLMKLGGEQRLALAMTLYKRIAASVSPRAPASSADSHSYWLAHLRMLQILDKVNRNTEKILPQIERLRLEDANYGGERFRRGFDALRMKYGGR
jgi:tetratricopeptide (TPR) repeat protein